MTSLSNGPGEACFSKAPETILSSSVSKNSREVYTPETSWMKGTSVHIKNMRIKQLCHRKAREFAMAFRARKVSGAFEKQAPDLKPIINAWREWFNQIYNWGIVFNMMGVDLMWTVRWAVDAKKSNFDS